MIESSVVKFPVCCAPWHATVERTMLQEQSFADAEFLGKWHYALVLSWPERWFHTSLWAIQAMFSWPCHWLFRVLGCIEVQFQSDRDAAAISRCSGHGLGYSIYATPRCSVVEIRGGSSKLNDLASIVHVTVELMQKYAKVDRIVGTDKFDSLWSWQLL